MESIVDQVKKVRSTWRDAKNSKMPAAMVRLTDQCLQMELAADPVILDTLLPLQEDQFQAELMENVPCIVNMQRLNDIRYINKFLESVNRCLPLGGRFIGCVEPSAMRKEKVMAQFPRPLNKLYYVFDYLVKRVWPKLPYLKRAYFFLTKGRNRVLSEMEAYGRLYACGFRLLEAEEENGQLYFAVEKTGEPDYNTEATYGPFIKLRRVGKGGKIVKVYKMRTMYPYSEYVQQLVYERNGTGSGAKFKDDPRITTVGRIMRKYWIDELPMLYNLIKGDLKIFGVRPISKHYFSLYPEEFQNYRKDFTPGLIPPVYVEIPKCIEDTIDIERRYLQQYERQPLLTDIRYTYRALYNIFIKKVRSS